MASPVPTAPAGWPPVSQVDPTVPIFGNPTTLSVRQNFAIIQQELTDLATQVGLGEPTPVANGGTGASTTPQGLLNLGIAAYLQSYLSNLFGPIPLTVQYGGTGANNVFQARLNLGVPPINNANLTGNPTVPTPPAQDNSSTIANTAFVQNAIGAYFPITVAHGGTGATTPAGALTNLGAAPINSPLFTGVPFAPNPNAGTNNQQIATCAFVMAAVAAGGGGGGGAPPVTYGPVAPSNPAVGQLWFDTGTSTLMVWSGSAWTVTVPAGAAGPPGPPGVNYVSDTAPAQPPAVAGNLWWDSTDGQMYILFNNQGTNQWVVANNQPGQAGPQGATGAPGPAGPPGTPWPEAPTDGSIYGRDGATTSWQLVPPEAPLGGLAYLRIGGNQANPGSWVPGLPISGGTLTGALTLDGNATAALQPVTLQQMNSVTNLLAPINNPTFTGTVTIPAGASIAGYLPLSGGTLSGALGVNAAITSSTGSSAFGPTTINGNLTVSQGITINGNGVNYPGVGGSNHIGFVWGAAVTVFVDGTNVGNIQMQSSDASLKENFATISVDPLAILNQVQLQQFDWIPTTLQPSRPHVSVGMTAQNVETLIPEAVSGTEGNLGVDLMPVVSYCIGAIQHLVAMVQQLQTAVGALQQNTNQTVTAWDAV